MLHSKLIYVCLMMIVANTIVPFKTLKQNHSSANDLTLNQQQQQQSYLVLCFIIVLFVMTILCESLFVYLLIVCKVNTLKQFLSSSLLVPIGRLSLAIYLLNPLVNWHNLHQSRQASELTFRTLVKLLQ